MAVAALAFAVPAQEDVVVLAAYDFGQRTHRADLPGRLDEVSGLAFTPDGRLFAHGDERAWVIELDVETGEPGKRFMLGERTARDDFEGIAFAGERLFLVSSSGRLYESREGADRQEMPYAVTDVGLGDSCEVEGLEYDPTHDELLFLCKVSLPDDGSVVVHRVPLDPSVERRAPLRIPREGLLAFDLKTDFHGSGITIDRETGHLLIVAAREELLMEVDADGRIVTALALSRRRHPQPEGIAIGPDGTLYIADERNGRSPRLTLYARMSSEAER